MLNGCHMHQICDQCITEMHKIWAVHISIWHHYNALQLWSVHDSKLSIEKVCANVVSVAGNSSVDGLVAWLLLSIEVQNSQILGQASSSRAGIEKFWFLSSKSVEIHGILCDLWNYLLTPWKKGNKIPTLPPKLWRIVISIIGNLYPQKPRGK